MPKKVAEIQALRGLAILLVVSYHFLARWTPPVSPVSYYFFGGMFLRSPLAVGWMGVQLFFMISGFVIARTLQSTDTAWRFLINRICRLMPTIWLTIPLVFVAVNLLNAGPFAPIPVGRLLPSLTLVHPSICQKFFHDPTTGDWVTGVLWSLWVEVEFYVIAAVLYFRLSKSRLNMNLVLLSAIGAVVVSLRIAGIIPTAGVTGALTQVFCYLPWFAAGAIFSSQSWSGTPMSRRNALGGLFLLTSALAIGIARNNVFPIEQSAIALVLNASFFLIFGELAAGRRLRLLRGKILGAIGNLSFEMYLLHEALGVTIAAILVSASGNVGIKSAQFIAVVISLFALAFIIEKFYSRWATKRLKAVLLHIGL